MAPKKKHQPSLAEQLRRAVLESPETAYRISLDAEVDQGSLSRFMSERVDLSLENASRLASYFGLVLMSPYGPKKTRRSR